MKYINATKTLACCLLYFSINRSVWIATDMGTKVLYGRFNGEYFS